MFENWNKKQMTQAALIVAILILMVQNFLLTRLNNEQKIVIEGLNKALDFATQIQVGDSLRVFPVLDKDSLVVDFQPWINQKNMLLFVFTTWCPLYEKNMPQWDKLVGDLSGVPGLTIVGLTSDSLYKIIPYQQRALMHFPFYSLAGDMKTLKRYKLLSYPSTLLLDSTGRVIDIWRGLLTDTERKNIRKAIEDRGSS